MVICAFNHKTLLDMGRCNDKEIDTSVDNDLILRYKISLRLHLGYCVWNPHLRKNAGVLEKVQRGQTSMIEVLGKLNYEERLKRYKLTTLEKKGSKANLIEFFKIEEGGFLPQQFCEIKKNIYTREHNSKLCRKASGNLENNYFNARLFPCGLN